MAGHSGVLRIYLPGGASMRYAPFAITLPLPHVAITAVNGTMGPLAITLDVPRIQLAGKVRHNPLSIKIPAPRSAMIATVLHQPLHIAIPASKTGLAGAVTHCGRLVIDLSENASSPFLVRTMQQQIRQPGTTHVSVS